MLVPLGNFALRLCAVMLLFGGFPPAAAADVYWPTQGWRSAAPETQGMRTGPLADLVARIGKQGHEIDSVTVIRNGYLVLDAYFHPFAPGRKHIVHSVTKSVTSTLYGIALDQGLAPAIDRPVSQLFPDKDLSTWDAAKRALTVKHLLTMTSGLDCRDSSRHGRVGLAAMHRSPDWTQYVLDRPLVAEPGRQFEYCHGASYLLSTVVERGTGQPALEFARQHLFAPLGIADTDWSVNAQGRAMGYGYLWLHPRDMAKIGWLFLNRGRWDGRQIVPAAWVDAATRVQTDATWFDGYGYQWWVDEDYYAAVGFGGQFIFVVPDKRLVAVFTSDLDGPQIFLPRRLLKRYILPAIVSDAAIAADPRATARLTSLVTAAVRPPEDGVVWRDPADGVLRDGVFSRAAAPAFRFQVPMGSRKQDLQGRAQVMRMKTPSGIVFAASVGRIPRNLPLSKVGPNRYGRALERLGGNVELLRNQPVRLADGTPAYRTDWQWDYGNWRLTTFLVSAYVDGKWLYLSANHRDQGREAASIVETLRLR